MCLCSHEKWKLRYLVPALGDQLVTAARSEPPHQTRALRVGMREIALTQPPGTCDEIWDFGLGLPAATGTVDCRSRPVAVMFLYFAPALWCLKRGRTQPADSSIFDRKMLRTPQARHHTRRFSTYLTSNGCVVCFLEPVRTVLTPPEASESGLTKSISGRVSLEYIFRVYTHTREICRSFPNTHTR